MPLEFVLPLPLPNDVPFVFDVVAVELPFVELDPSAGKSFGSNEAPSVPVPVVVELPVVVDGGEMMEFARGGCDVCDCCNCC